MVVAVENLVVIGSGPAGYTAALYAARARLKPVLFAGSQAGGAPGGQLMTTAEVENYPGFPQGITGPELMLRMHEQAIRWGTECHTEDVIAVDLSQRPFTVRSRERVLKAHSLIVATGAAPQRLNLPSEAQFWNAGIAACALCDGAAPIFRDAEIAVVGGGDAAAEEAVYLTRYASQVHLLVRRDRLRASKTLRDRVLAHPQVTVHWQTKVIDAFGGERLEGLWLRDLATNRERELPVRGLFYAIGHQPNTELFKGQLDCDETGFIITQADSVATSVAGVFAAGDVQDRVFRQAITAAGTGCQAALLAERWLSQEGLLQEFEDVTSEVGRVTPKAVSESQGILDPAIIFDSSRTRHVGGYALRKLFHESDRLLMVLYASPHCGPCYTLKQTLDKVIDEYEGRIHFVEIDVEAEPEIAEKALLSGTPTVQFFQDKAIVQQLRGFKQKSEFRQVLDRLLGVAAY
ncbi:MAG: thioredoxin-disulfide reductase [Cyanobacteria bacterium J06641_5]